MSSLLPKNVESFADSAYWREFFKKRGEKVFEWYGSYGKIGHNIEKYLKPNDRILQIGCGNSTLADDLYDNGFRHVISIDIVEDVIKRQKQKNATIRPELEFYAADVTNADESLLQSIGYQAIVDKGTLDALLPPDCGQEQVALVRKMFEQVHRILAIGGRYLVITLAQPEIVRLWLANFRNAPERSYILRVQQLNHGRVESGDDWRLPTFLLVATKLRAPGEGKIPMTQMFEYLNSRTGASPRRLTNADDLIEAVKGAQEYAIFCDKARSKDLAEELRIDLHSSDSSPDARYRIYVTTAMDRKLKYAHPYAIFAVPQGREHEWLFSSAKGRRELCVQASAQRLAVVCLGRGHTFPNLDTVKEELNERVLDFAPADTAKNTGRQIPYLSLGDDLGERTVVHRGESDFSGQFVVEDVTIGKGKDKTVWRRLVFLKSQNLIQSEAKLLNQRSSKKKQIDWSYLACAHHRIMLAALAVPENQKTFSVCLLGLGGGCLATFIWKHFSEACVTTVELDPKIVDAACDHFEYPRSNNKIKCVVDDGLDFIRKTSESDGHFHVVLLDIAGPSHIGGISCPLPTFLESDCLQKLKKILHNDGVLAFNVVTRDSEKRKDVLETIGRHFPYVVRRMGEEDLNEVLLCFGEEKSDTWKEEFEKRLRSVCQRLTTKCDGFNELKRLDSLDVEGILEKLANL